MNATATNPARRSILKRSIGYFALWMIMAGGEPADIGPGVVAALLAAWVSVLLMPPDPGSGGARLLTILRAFARFFWGSVLGGVDVARRAFSPSLPLRLGFVVYPAQLPSSAARNLFQSLTSMMPGTLPSGIDDDGALVYHCLDVSQPVGALLETEERMLIEALGGALGSGTDVGSDRTPQDGAA